MSLLPLYYVNWYILHTRLGKTEKLQTEAMVRCKYAAMHEYQRGIYIPLTVLLPQVIYTWLCTIISMGYEYCLFVCAGSVSDVIYDGCTCVCASLHLQERAMISPNAYILEDK